jgi:hypothetical protein
VGGNNEADRLRVLRAFTGAIRANMHAFQPIAELAKERFGVPIDLVSVIDADHQIYLGTPARDRAAASPILRRGVDHSSGRDPARNHLSG